MEDDGPAYDLEERTFQFALGIRRCVAGVKWTREQWSDIDQALRASGPSPPTTSRPTMRCPKAISSSASKLPRRRQANAASGSGSSRKPHKMNLSNKNSAISARRPTNSPASSPPSCETRNDCVFPVRPKSKH